MAAHPISRGLSSAGVGLESKSNGMYWDALGLALAEADVLQLTSANEKTASQTASLRLELGDEKQVKGAFRDQHWGMG